MRHEVGELDTGAGTVGEPSGPGPAQRAQPPLFPPWIPTRQPHQRVSPNKTGAGNEADARIQQLDKPADQTRHRGNHVPVGQPAVSRLGFRQWDPAKPRLAAGHLQGPARTGTIDTDHLLPLVLPNVPVAEDDLQPLPATRRGLRAQQPPRRANPTRQPRSRPRRRRQSVHQTRRAPRRPVSRCRRPSQRPRRPR